ncbi:AMP-binding protein [Staphylococcus aureus]|nr:AMP-binding protein [Staphylococcus aureus]
MKINAVIALEPFTVEFEKIKEYDVLTKFVIAGQKDGWISLEAEKENASNKLEMADTTRDDMAILSYTSGTTGNPKAVTHCHGWGFAHLQMAPKHWLCINEDDLVWQQQHQVGKMGMESFLICIRFRCNCFCI